MRHLLTFTLIFLLSFALQATTLIPYNSDPKNLGIANSVTSDEVKFNFTAFDTSNNAITDVLVFYSTGAVEQLGGVEEVNRYVRESIAFANKAYENSHIPITRRIASVLPVPFPYDFMTIQKGFGLWEFMRHDLHVSHAHYNASYYVLMHAYDYEEDERVAGTGVVGGQYTTLRTFQRSGGSNYVRALGHELGHNDGLMHNLEDTSELTNHGNGHTCGAYKSIMSNESKQGTIPFFSSPNTLNDGEACGDAALADSTDAYMSELPNSFKNKSGTFFNIKDPIKATGSVAFQMDSATVNESDGVLSIPIEWIGAKSISSVEVFVDLITADGEDAIYFSKHISSDTDVIELTLLDDSVTEDLELVSVSMRYPININLGANKSVLVTIMSDEHMDTGQVSFAKSSGTVQEGGNLTVTLNRTAGSASEIQVKVTTIEGSADTSDFNSLERTITFAEGETSKTFTTVARNDTNDEATESYTIELTSDNPLSLGNTTSMLVSIFPKNLTIEKEESSGGTNGLFIISLLLLVNVMNRKNLKM